MQRGPDFEKTHPVHSRGLRVLRMALGAALAPFVACAIPQAVEAPFDSSDGGFIRPKPVVSTVNYQNMWITSYRRCFTPGYSSTITIGSDGRHRLSPYGQKDTDCREIQFSSPIIDSVNPVVASPGDLVTIKGTGFLQPGVQPAYLEVRLFHDGGGAGLLTSVVPSTDVDLVPPVWEEDKITFQVPGIPEQSGRLTVMIGGGTGNGRFANWPGEFAIRP